MSFCTVLFACFLSMLIIVILSVLSHCGSQKCLDVAKGAESSFSKGWGWRQLYIEQVKCHGDHFDAWSLPSELCFFSDMHPSSRSFQRLTSHLIACHYPHHRNLIQFGCCWCLENGWIWFCPRLTEPPGHCPQTLTEVHWQVCQYVCNKLWSESRLLPFVVSCRLLQQVSGQ